MGSGGGGGDGGGMMALMQQGTPMPGLPIAGQGGGVNPREYGMFQNFLPEPLAEGQNPMATGLRPDMLKYRSPGGVVAEGSGGAGGSNEIQGLRDELAALKAGGAGDGGGQAIPGYSPFDNLSPGYGTNGVTPGRGGGIGTMGMGGGFRGSAFLPDGQTPVQMQGRYGGTDQYGRGNFSSGPVDTKYPILPMPPGG